MNLPSSGVGTDEVIVKNDRIICTVLIINTIIIQSVVLENSTTHLIVGDQLARVPVESDPLGFEDVLELTRRSSMTMEFESIVL